MVAWGNNQLAHYQTTIVLQEIISINHPIKTNARREMFSAGNWWGRARVSDCNLQFESVAVIMVELAL